MASRPYPDPQDRPVPFWLGMLVSTLMLPLAIGVMLVVSFLSRGY
jgi:hypothetical protein